MKWISEFFKGMFAYKPTAYNIGMLVGENMLYWVVMMLFMLGVLGLANLVMRL
jgi:hypothetical protein